MSDLMIYGAIGWDVNALDTVREISKAKGKPMNVRVNSPGGYVWEGLAIANALRGHGQADTFVDGIAASMGSVIFLAGKKRTMASGTRLMIHNPTSFAGGESKDMRKEADVLDGTAADLALMYSESTGGIVSVERAREMMDAETWLTAEEAVALGFAHGIEGKATAFAKIPESMQYRNAPKEAKLDPEEKTPEPGLLDRMMAKLTGTESMRADIAKMETALAESVQRTMKAETDLASVNAAMEAMKAKLTGTESMRADIAKMETALAESVQRTMKAETDLASVNAAMEAMKAEHAAALEAARIEGAQAHEKSRLQGSAPEPLPHVEEQTETFTTHTAKEAAMRASGDPEAAKYYAQHKTAILKGE